MECESVTLAFHISQAHSVAFPFKVDTSSWSVHLFINPNRSLDRYSAIRYRYDNFLPYFIFLLASCFLFVLAVARYAFELTTNHLLNKPMKSVQNLITDLGSTLLPFIFVFASSFPVPAFPNIHLLFLVALYMYMGRYSPKEWINRRKVTNHFRDVLILLFVYSKMLW